MVLGIELMGISVLGIAVEGNTVLGIAVLGFDELGFPFRIEISVGIKRRKVSLSTRGRKKYKTIARK